MTEILDTIREHSGPLTVSRAESETIQRGYTVPGAIVVSGIEGHIQPLSPKELRLTPAGMNEMEWHHIWALSEIKVDDLITDGTAPAVKVLKLEHWKEAPYWHGQGVIVDDAPSRIFPFQGSSAFTLPILGLVAVGAHP